MLTKLTALFSMALWTLFMGAIIKGFFSWLEAETGTSVREPELRVVK